MRTTIITWSGLEVDPLAVQEGDIDIYDIAHALSRQCRYLGHTFGHLSVARHSLWVADYLHDEPIETQLWGLLHDAAEAYIGDMPGPMKHRDAMRRFRQAETMIELTLAHVYELPWPRPEAVAEADARVCELECKVERYRADYAPQDDECDFLEEFFRLEQKR